MIKPVTMYSVICDRCGKTFETDGCIAWTDKQSAIYYALASEWKEIGDKHYCPDCYEFNDIGDPHIVCYDSETQRSAQRETTAARHGLKVMEADE